MDIEEIRRYPHKITKINVTNSNDTSQSDYNTAMLKVTINDKNDNEVIVFSTDAELQQIVPSKKNNNDYYLSIANQQGVSTIYAHYLMADLYDYKEDESNSDIFFSYDLSQLKNLSEKRHYQISEGNKPKISSLIQGTNGTEEEKNPNYKHYSQEKGHLPIVSRYNINGIKQLTAPVLNQTPSAHWNIQNTLTNNLPQWEVHIPRKDLKIVKEDINITNPLNVYLNYQYLPTSTEYHQHFFGFEDRIQTQCKNINVLDGDNLNIVNKNFGTDGTYRLININNKTDTTRKIYVKHNKQETIDIDNPVIHNNSCSFEKNRCENYYIYKPQSDKEDYGLHINLPTKKDTDYILKYYIWIPNSSYKESDDINVQIQYTKDFESSPTLLAELDKRFRTQDKFLNQQWIYHEIPFSTVQSKNQLYIKGPRYDGNDKKVFFCNFVLEEIVPYSPTIKYTNQGVFVMEGDSDFINMPNKNHTGSNPCDDTQDVGDPIKHEELPTPHTNVYIDFGDNFEINYSQRTKLLTYNPVGCTITYDKESGSLKYDAEDNISLNYNNYIFTADYEQKNKFTRGINNEFILKIRNEDNAVIKDGYVECCITTSKTDDECIRNLGKKNIDSDGIVKYSRLNFSKLTNDTYYIKIKYVNPCYDDIIEFKKIHLIDEEPIMSIKANDKNVDDIVEINSIDDFPLNINAYITAQDVGTPIDGGYCELSIDDEVKYSTFVSLINNEAVADFYLNCGHDDIQDGTSIKIAYYNKKNDDGKGGYFNPLIVKYFTINMPQSISCKDPVPIRTRILINDREEQNSKSITLNDKDCLLIDLSTNERDLDENEQGYINYSIRLYKEENLYNIFDNNKSYINITSYSNESIIILDFLEDKLGKDEKREVKYTIVTDNAIDDITIEDDKEVITYLNDKYRQYKQEFTVVWNNKEA